MEYFDGKKQCSEAFNNGYHIIKSDKGNYLHLIGIHTTLFAEEFFDKCNNGTLGEADFGYVDCVSV